MAFLDIPKVRIKGIAAIVPDKVISNYDYYFTTEKEKQTVIDSIGIKEKRIAPKGICTSDLGVSVTEKLIVANNWKKEEIELLIFVSQSRDYILPNTACIIQHKLGLSKKCMAFDIPLGCSGYTYGLSIASSLMSNGGIKKAILIAGDVSSYTLSQFDKSVYPLFGDAVTATLLEFTDDTKDSMSFNLQTDGNGYEAIIIPDGGTRNMIDYSSLEMKEYENGIRRMNTNITLDGMKIFEFSIREVAKNIKQLLAHINREIYDFDYYVFHQANLLMNETIRKQLKLPIEKVPYSLEKYGNTSSASIPLTIVTELSNQVRHERHTFIFSSFGVGLSWASVALEISNIICLPIIEYPTK